MQLSTGMRLSTGLALTSLVFSGLWIASYATAQQPTLAEPAVEALAIEAEATVDSQATAVSPSAVVCCPINVARHHVTFSAKRTYRCEGSKPVTLCVENPADCCVYAVELCVPCCCVGEPFLCSAECGLLGRSVVTYAWDCGLCAKVVFRARGDAVVTYSM